MIIYSCHHTIEVRPPNSRVPALSPGPCRLSPLSPVRPGPPGPWRAEREKICEVSPGLSHRGRGPQGGGGHRSGGEPLVRHRANGRAFPKMWIFRNRNPCGLADSAGPPSPRYIKLCRVGSGLADDINGICTHLYPVPHRSLTLTSECK